MAALFSRYLTPLTYVMYAMLIIGGIDHFAVEFLPRQVAGWNLIIIWPVLAFIWYGHRYNARLQAQELRNDDNDSA